MDIIIYTGVDGGTTMDSVDSSRNIGDEYTFHVAYVNCGVVSLASQFSLGLRSTLVALVSHVT